MRKGLFLFMVVVLVSSAGAVLAEEPTGGLCNVENADQTPQTVLEEPAELGAEPLAEPALQIGGEPCGGVICPIKQYCCNPTCNACLPFGMSCTMEACNSTSLETEAPATVDPGTQLEPTASEVDGRALRDLQLEKTRTIP